MLVPMRDFIRKLKIRYNGKRIVWLSNLSSSGGTILTKFFSCADELVILNEIHPNYPIIKASTHAPMHLSAQMNARYPNLFDHNFAAKAFERELHLVIDHAQACEKHLVLRDWAHFDFIVNRNSEGVDVLDRLLGPLNPMRIVLIRDPLDTFLSASSSGFIDMPFELFCECYEKFLDWHNQRSTIMINYEKFVSDQRPVRDFLEKNKIVIPDDYEARLHLLGFSGASGRNPEKIRTLDRRFCDDYDSQKFNTKYIKLLKKIQENHSPAIC